MATKKSDLFYVAPPVQLKVSPLVLSAIVVRDRLHQVEDELFKLARESLESSSKFMEMYKIPSVSGADASMEPASESGLVELHDITAREFTAFLKLLLRPWVFLRGPM